MAKMKRAICINFQNMPKMTGYKAFLLEKHYNIKRRINIWQI